MMALAQISARVGLLAIVLGVVAGLILLMAGQPHLPILTGAERPSLYLPLLKNKRVGLFINQTSRVGNEGLVDFLQMHGIHVVKIFVPEHGLHGDVGAGIHIANSVDLQTSAPIISLYGKKVKPTHKDLQGIDILVFDVQDVGVRFYTFLSSLQRLMEAAVENGLPLIVLDRPDPNGFYVDGPVLNMKYKSFAGLQPVPVVYGMTAGEYAKMLVGENWLDVVPKSKATSLKLIVIPNLNYTHHSLYVPPIRPSPNLPSIQSIYWYPSIGLMEGTNISVGRGTTQPFQVFGHPHLHSAFSFVPRSLEGANDPLYKNQTVYGFSLAGTPQQVLKAIHGQLQIKYFIQLYRAYPELFTGSQNAITDELIKQVQAGMSEQQIRASWEPKLSEFKQIRKKYLLYPD